MGFDALSRALRRRLTAATTLALVVGLLHGCATTAPPSGTPPAAPDKRTPPASTAPSPASAVGIERQWLQSWFEGTPVRIVQHGADAISVEVPLEFCFAAGQSKIQPPLAAVLDKVSQSLLRRPNLRLELLAAPGDAAASSTLGRQRADQVRSHLLARGVPSWQLAAPSVTALAAVQLRIDSVAP